MICNHQQIGFWSSPLQSRYAPSAGMREPPPNSATLQAVRLITDGRVYGVFSRNFGVAWGDSGFAHKNRVKDMQKGLRQINVNGFLGKNVEVAIYDGTKILGELVGIDCSRHGFMGNLTLRYNGGLNVIRGDSVRSIALAAKIWVSEPIYNQIEKIAEENGVDVDELANGILEFALDRVKDSDLMEAVRVG